MTFVTITNSVENRDRLLLVAIWAGTGCCSSISRSSHYGCQWCHHCKMAHPVSWVRPMGESSEMSSICIYFDGYITKMCCVTNNELFKVYFVEKAICSWAILHVQWSKAVTRNAFSVAFTITVSQCDNRICDILFRAEHTVSQKVCANTKQLLCSAAYSQAHSEKWPR